MEKVDRLDKKILSILSQNARMPFKDVAAQCGVSRAAINVYNTSSRMELSRGVVLMSTQRAWAIQLVLTSAST